MSNRFHPFRSNTFRCMFFVALCFGLSSAVYLSWLNRLVSLAGAEIADWGSMVAGYLFQAAGMGVTAFLLRREQEENHCRVFLTGLTLFIAVTIPALISDSTAGAIIFGLLMNGLFGILAGFYLYAIGLRAPEDRKGLVFGGGYAAATAAVGLLSLIGAGGFLHSSYALILYVSLSVWLGIFTFRSGLLAAPAAETDVPANKSDLPGIRSILLAVSVVTLISLVKNLGYGFPSADIADGLIPELSRLPYAVGLIAAGLIQDRDRRSGMICTISALILPFLMLGLIDEPVSGTVFWGLDYVFFAFFSVYRVVLFLDLAKRTGHWELAPLGLLAGRIGDAAGTAVNLLLAEHKIVLIGLAGALFIPSVFLIFLMHRRVYEPEIERARQEKERFDDFCESHDFSEREKEVFRMLLEKNTNASIAERLFISENTVKYHVRNILQKVGCKNRMELLYMYSTPSAPEADSDRDRA